MSSSEEPRASGSGSQSDPPSQTMNGTRKKGRYANIEEMFAGSTPEEVEMQTAQYRSLLNEAEETKGDLANKTFKDIRSAVKSGEALFKTTKDTGVASLDAKLMHTTVESAVAMARKNRVTGGSFNIDEFLIRIGGVLGLDRVEREDMSPSSEDELEDETQAGPSRPARARVGRLGDWEKLGWMAAKHTRRVPGVEFMYGPLAVEHKKRVQQTQKRRRSVGAEQRPQEIVHQAKQKGQKAAADDMVHNVMTVQKLLVEKDQGEGINFLELVINPDDYGQTVENIFYASFLIKEGQAGIQVDDDGQVIIRNELDRQGDANEDVPKNQAVIELDMDTWREAKKLLKIKKPIIPHREYGLANAARPEAGAWYN